jgi:hypothetical protein
MANVKGPSWRRGAGRRRGSSPAVAVVGALGCRASVGDWGRVDRFFFFFRDF